jgi:hypothetical protein
LHHSKSFSNEAMESLVEAAHALWSDI